MNIMETNTHAVETSAFKGIIRPVLVSALFFCLLTGIAYPLATTGVAQLLFPSQANGSLITGNGKVVGSRLIGQYFTSARYFHSRPSDTSNHPYNAAASGAGNLGPTSKKLIATVGERVVAYRKENGLASDASVPADAATASASGLDPNISIANARLQAARVAKARGMARQQVLALVKQHTHGRQFGLLGVPRVNVLELNLALDAATTSHAAAH